MANRHPRAATKLKPYAAQRCLIGANAAQSGFALFDSRHYSHIPMELFLAFDVFSAREIEGSIAMHSIIYLVGLVVVVMFVLSAIGIH